MRNPLRLVAALAFAATTMHAQTQVYLGTYTQGESQGIYRAYLDLEKGCLSEAQLAAEADNPNFLALAPSGDRLYSIGDIESDGRKIGGVSAYRIAHDGSLELLNQQPSQGRGPCYVSLDASGEILMVANYSSGSIASYRVQSDGSIGSLASVHQHHGSGPNPSRQEGPHAHCILPGPDSRYAYAVDLGIDQALIYSIDRASGALHPIDPSSVRLPAGGGPRHIAFHPTADFAYVNLELSSQVTAMQFDRSTGGLRPFQTLSSLPADASTEGNTTAEILVHPSGRYLYVSNRGHDSIACYRIDAESGELRFTGTDSTLGRTPRNFAIDPSGAYLVAANQDSDSVVVFRISRENGRLSATGSEIKVPSPVRVVFRQP